MKILNYQKKGITIFIEVILNQELGESFRRDVMRKPDKIHYIKKIIDV